MNTHPIKIGGYVAAGTILGISGVTLGTIMGVIAIIGFADWLTTD
jgi:hypothetical protein